MLDKCLKQAGSWLWKKTITSREQQYWDAPPSSPPPSWPLRAWYSGKALTLRALLPALVWLLVVSFVGVALILGCMALIVELSR